MRIDGGPVPGIWWIRLMRLARQVFVFFVCLPFAVTHGIHGWPIFLVFIGAEIAVCVPTNLLVHLWKRKQERKYNAVLHDYLNSSITVENSSITIEGPQTPYEGGATTPLAEALRNGRDIFDSDHDQQVCYVDAETATRILRNHGVTAPIDEWVADFRIRCGITKKDLMIQTEWPHGESHLCANDKGLEALNQGGPPKKPNPRGALA